MVSRNKILYIWVPVMTLMGIYAIVSELTLHGLSGAVIVGLLGGACCAVAMIAFAVANWNRTWSAAERQKSREAFAHVRSVYVPLGLVAAAAFAAVGTFVGGGKRDLGTALLVGVGVVFIAASVLTALIVVKRRGSLYSDASETAQTPT